LPSVAAGQLSADAPVLIRIGGLSDRFKAALEGRARRSGDLVHPLGPMWAGCDQNGLHPSVLNPVHWRRVWREEPLPLGEVADLGYDASRVGRSIRWQ